MRQRSWPCSLSRIRSSPVNSSELSRTNKRRSASFKTSLVRRMPSSSIRFSAFRRPAVSISRIRNPERLTYSSIMSRVVPGTEETMARSVLSNALSKLDFPTLGLPIIAALIPSRIIRPSSNVSIMCWSLAWISLKTHSNCSFWINEISSSTKSIPASRWARLRINSSFNSSTSRLSIPRRRPWALQRLLVVAACMVSRTASACIRSRRPFRNARFVNSPGSAILASCCIRASQIFCIMKGPPWVCISTTSSPV